MLARDPVVDRIGSAVAVSLTRVRHGRVSKIELTTAGVGAPSDCMANFDNIHTIPRYSFRRMVVKLVPVETGRSLADSTQRHRLLTSPPRCRLSVCRTPLTSPVSPRGDIIEHMFVLARIQAVGLAHRRPRPGGSQKQRDPDHCKQVMRAEHLSARPITCLRGYRRNALGSPVKRTIAEFRLRRPTVWTNRHECSDHTVSAGLPVCAERSGLATRAGRLRSSSSNPLPMRTAAGHYSHIMVNAVAVARQLIQIVATDPGLPRYLRREASSLESLVSSKPELVLDNLEALRERVIPDLALVHPTADYARCASVDVFWDYHMNPDRREFFANDARVYRRYLESVADPVHAIRRDLRESEILVPAAHSWMVPSDQIAALDGTKTKSHLQIDDDPPYIVMTFPVAKMQASGVEIRAPRGVDAIPNRLVRWSRGGVPNERIDQDIPTAALGCLEWRP